MAEIKICKLTNGATLIYQKQNLNNTTEVVCVFKGGAKLDGGITGLTHLAEHLMFSDNEKYSDKQMFRLIKNTGTNQSAGTTYDYVYTKFDCASEHFYKMLDLNIKALLNRNYSMERINKEIEIIENERLSNISNDSLLNHALANISKVFDKNQIQGGRQSLSVVTPDIINTYIENNFTPKNLVISVVSNFSFEQIKAVVTGSFVLEMTKSARENNFVYENEMITNNKYFLSYLPNHENAYINILMPHNLCDKIDDVDITIIRAIEEVKFNDFGGLLYNYTRLENQISYQTFYNFVDTTNVMVSIFNCITKPENTNECIFQIARAINTVRNSGVTQEDFDDVMQNFKAKLAREYNSNLNHGNAFENAENYILNKQPFTTNDILIALNTKGLTYYNELFKKIYENNNIHLCVSGTYDMPSLPSAKQIQNWAFGDNEPKKQNYYTIVSDSEHLESISPYLNYYNQVNGITLKDMKMQKIKSFQNFYNNYNEEMQK